MTRYIVFCILFAWLGSVVAKAVDIVPIPDSARIYSWAIDERFGTPKRVPFDTIPLNFQNYTLQEGNSASKAYLGNLGSPTYDRIFEKRGDDPLFLFHNVFTDLLPSPDKVNYVNSKIPITNVLYQTAGGIQNREERFKVHLSLNANKAFNFGARLDYVYARGFYANQRVRKLDYQFYGSYVSDRYVLHAFINPYDMQNFENGGLSDDRYITDPDAVQGKNPVESQDFPTVLGDDVSNKNSGGVYFLSHRYNLGFYKEIQTDTVGNADSTIIEEFVPVSSVIHTLQLSQSDRLFHATGLPVGYYQNNYFSADSTNDRTGLFSLKNTFALQLREGFNKYAKAGLTAYATADIRSYSVMNNLGELEDVGETSVAVGAELSKRQGEVITYAALGELGVVGKDAGQVKLIGDLHTNFRLGKENVSVNLFGSMKNLLPNFYYRRYNSNHFRWDNDFSFEQRVRLGGSLTMKKFDLGLRFSVENLTNYIYLDSIGPKQNSGSVQVITATLHKNFAFRAWHWDNEATFQQSSNQAVLPLPTFTIYSNMYILTKISNVLTMQLGADCRYYTKYHAMGYQPALGQYYVQDKIEIGGYPHVNLYANMHLKQARFFVMYSNAGAGLLGKDYFLAPHYAMNPTVLRLGISVNFFN